MFRFVVVFYGVAGPCIQTMVKKVKKGEKGKKEPIWSMLVRKGVVIE